MNDNLEQLETQAYHLVELMRRRFNTKHHFTQGSYARDRQGTTVHHTSPRAESFCLLGNLYRTAYEQSLEDWYAQERLRTLMFDMTAVGGPLDLADFNDNFGHEAVIALLDAYLVLNDPEETT